ncbi:Trehalose synthase [Minicystis rosea]|nr:Trehalose synthase [Minicystis rosea]
MPRFAVGSGVPEQTDLSKETALLDAIDAAIDAPDDEDVGRRLNQAWSTPPSRYSAAGAKRLRAHAARRGEPQQRGIHLVLIDALKKQDDPEAIAFMLDMLLDEGFAWRAAVALDLLDPVLVAQPLRDWLAGRDPEALPDPLGVRALRAKIDLASPPAGAAEPVTPDLLEHWIRSRSFVALRLALAHGISADTTLGEGETLLHHAIAAWTLDDQLATGEPDEPTRADWEAFIGELFAAGAKADRRLTNRFSGVYRRWPKGTTPRDMLDLEREDRGVPAAVIDRLEARFPPRTAAPRRSPSRRPRATSPSGARSTKPWLDCAAPRSARPWRRRWPGGPTRSSRNWSLALGATPPRSSRRSARRLPRQPRRRRDGWGC